MMGGPCSASYQRFYAGTMNISTGIEPKAGTVQCVDASAARLRYHNTIHSQLPPAPFELVFPVASSPPCWTTTIVHL